MYTSSLVQWTIEDYVAEKLCIGPTIARNLVKLFDDGYEIVFIARYRRYLIGGLTVDDLRNALDARNTAKMVKARATKLIERADSEVEDLKERESLKAALAKSKSAVQLESLFAPFKRTSEGSPVLRALQLGLRFVCVSLLEGVFIDFRLLVDRQKEGLKTFQRVKNHVRNLLSHELHIRQETQDFVSEVLRNVERSLFSAAVPGASQTAPDAIATNRRYSSKEVNNAGDRVKVLVVSNQTAASKELREGDRDFPLLALFDIYINFKKYAHKVFPFQIMGLQRAESEGIITWKAQVEIGDSHPGRRVGVHPKHKSFLREAVADSTKHYLIPLIEQNIRKQLLEKAEQKSVECFEKNVRELLLSTSPLKGTAIVAIDPGYLHGCKCAVVSHTGEVLGTTVFYLKRSERDPEAGDADSCRADNWAMDEQGERDFLALTTSVKVDRFVIAIGNGTGGEEVQQAISAMIGRNAFACRDVHYCEVSECGASIYSVSEIAAEELPNMDMKLRSAVSLARRVIDPISEYVKIAPKHLGVGSYQHSVNEERLDEKLDMVVRECVSTVGVDVNVASLQLLQKVSGLNKETAANIIKFRRKNGRICNRESLKEVPGISEKIFEQCAGFLYIYEDDPIGGDFLSGRSKKFSASRKRNSLDRTPVHPESYHVAKMLIDRVGGTVDQIGTEELLSKLRNAEDEVKWMEPEVVVVWELLTRPLLIRQLPLLLKQFRPKASLKLGDIVDGVLRNHALFGVFVDIGAGRSALVHHTKLPDVLPQVNSRVKVQITGLLNYERIEAIFV